MAGSDIAISYTIDVEGTVAAFDDARLMMPRTAMYGMRRVGAAVRKVARAKAPVYKGPVRVGVIKGELRASIKASRNIRVGDGTLLMYIGPFGGGSSKSKGSRIRAKYASERKGAISKRDKGGVYGVSLYRDKQEVKFGYMATARDAAEAIAQPEFQKAIETMLAKLDR